MTQSDNDVFISYSRQDKTFVESLHQALEKTNHNVWVDWEDIPPTAEWRQEIYRGIEAADNFIFVISPNSIASRVCQEELAHAIQHAKRLIPIVWQEVDNQRVDPALAQLNYIFFRPQDDFDRAYHRLVEALSADLSHIQMHTRLLVRAKEWENRDQDHSLLLRGKYLEDAIKWLAQSSTKVPEPAELHRVYINTSHEAETARRAVELRLHRLTPQEYRNRQALLNKVRNYWVKGVLEPALHHRHPIPLALELRPEAVTHPWNSVSAVPEPLNLSTPHGTGAIAIFDQMGAGRTLLILGHPGSGKTITLLELAQTLVEKAESDIDQPIPAVFNLSSWACKQQTIAAWLVKELNIKYQVPQQIGDGWVQKQQLLLLLDGLDEVQVEQRAACVRALNQFNQDYGPEIVVCSRINDYEALTERLNFQGAIYLRSLTPAQIYQSLASTEASSAGLKALIEQDEALQELAQSPLMLNILAMAYAGISTSDVLITASEEEHRQQLFRTYIEQMLKRRGDTQTYPKPKIMHWLTWLAQSMIQSSQTIFLIEGMQPALLPTLQQRRIYRIGVRFLTATVWGMCHIGSLAFHQSLIGTLSLGSPAQALTWGLLGGLGGGLLYGVTSGLLSEWINAFTFRGRLINGLLLGLIFGPIFGLTWSDPLFGLAYGVVYGIAGLFIYGPLERDIESADALIWSWRKARNYLPVGLIIGLIFILTQVIPGPIQSLIFGLMVSLILGFEKLKEVDRKTFPNQGLWKSATNTGILFATVGLLTGILLGLLEGPVSGVVNGIILGTASALLGGQGSGVVCIKHFVLRFLLWRHGCIPWNYARFLNSAAEYVLLQKVGGGYVFIHRLLLEHFVRMHYS
ncbi:MAG: TIR domain-containing protein [Cyanothece sp. SIO1E1]|nr:TIR domain-containing protein [Cyanothece sp. SIO1E1]